MAGGMGKQELQEVCTVCNWVFIITFKLFGQNNGLPSPFFEWE